MDRRRFLVVAARGSVACLGGAAIGCGATGVAMPPEEVRRRAAELDPSLDCSDAAGLWPAEVRTRTDNQYVDHSPHELQFCFNCTNFVPPAEPGTCGTCTTVKGPISPGGWCKSWTERRQRG